VSLGVTRMTVFTNVYLPHTLNGMLLLNSHWAPEFHMEDLMRLKCNSKIPSNIHIEYLGNLRHDFVVHLDQVDLAASFCVNRILACSQVSVELLRSRL
jgi:hypothetical protein